MGRVIILMMDSLGIGASADADRFGDAGSNTLGSIAKFRASNGDGHVLNLPNLTRLGMMHAAEESCGEFPAGATRDIEVIGAYGYAKEISTG